MVTFVFWPAERVLGRSTKEIPSSPLVASVVAVGVTVVVVLGVVVGVGVGVVVGVGFGSVVWVPRMVGSGEGVGVGPTSSEAMVGEGGKGLSIGCPNSSAATAVATIRATGRSQTKGIRIQRAEPEEGSQG